MLQPDLLSRFTHHLKEVLQKSLAFTIASGRTQVLPGDLIVGILQEPGCIAAEVIGRASIRLEEAEQEFRGTPTPHVPGTPLAPDLSPIVKRMLEKAVLLAHLHEHRYIGTEHLLLALLELSPVDVMAYLDGRGFSTQQAKEQLRGVLQSITRFPEMSEKFGGEESDQEQEIEGEMPRGGMPMLGASSAKKMKALETFTRNVSSPEMVKTLDPVIGREAELQRLIEVLCRRTKNNPILLGEPGTGKTAIVEGLAQKLALGQVPDVLFGKRVHVVDLPLMVAGTMYRGEFEARLKQLVDEVKNDPNVILFIDEIHTLVGAGSTSGSMDAANMLKPALARGEIRCIGATTYAEYKKHIEPDSALERRFQPIDVEEPSAADTLKILRGIVSTYEQHHHVAFEKGVLERIVQWSERYLTDRFFPDKAIDILDEAAAAVSAKTVSSDEREQLQALEIAISATTDQKQQAQFKESYRSIEEKIHSKASKAPSRVTTHDIAQVVARISKIPLAVIEQTEKEELLSIEEQIQKRILGQDKAVTTVADALRYARLGFGDPKRPRASFLFVGPSGTGKTAMARSMAKLLFGKEEALIKLDMSEFAEGHSVSKLLGSPAGYVGYREGNRLADTIRKHPHAVLLFDEFEKAHPDVQQLLLQALEDGVITDGTGKSIPFKHTYIVLTSNIGSDQLGRKALGFDGAGSEAFSSRIHTELKERLKPELMSRIDHVIVFDALDDKTRKRIIKQEVETLIKRLKGTRNIQLNLDKSVYEWLLGKTERYQDGARGLRGVVERELMKVLAPHVITSTKKSATIKVGKAGLRIS